METNKFQSLPDSIENSLMFNETETNIYNSILFKHNGDIFIKGELATNNEDIVNGMSALLQDCGFTKLNNDLKFAQQETQVLQDKLKLAIDALNKINMISLSNSNVEKIAEETLTKLNDKYKNGTVLPSEVNKDGMRKVAEEMRKALKSVEIPKKQEKTHREKSTYEKLIQRFLTQFDKIHIKKGFESSGQRFIRRYKKNISQIEYVEFKIKQHERILKQKR